MCNFHNFQVEIIEMSFFKNKLKFLNNKTSAVSPLEINNDDNNNNMIIPLKIDLSDDTSCLCCCSRNSYYNELLFSSRTTLTQFDNFYDIDNLNYDENTTTASQFDINLSSQWDNLNKRKIKKRGKCKKTKRSKSSISNYSATLSSSGYGSSKVTPLPFDGPFQSENKEIISTQRSKSSCEKLKTGTSLKNHSFRFENAPFREFTTKATKLYKKLPEHDKKILNRMVMKRSEEIAMLEDAFLASKYWDAEKSSRDQLINEQNKKYFTIMREKRTQEQRQTEYLLVKLKKHQEYYEEQLKQELEEKDQRLLNRLKNLEIKRDLKQCERKQNEFCKNLQILQTQHEKELDSELKRQDICNRLELRITHADGMKKKLFNAYKNRLITENEIEQSMHAINYKEILNLEKYKHNKLKEELKARDKRLNLFNKHKNQCLESSREQARASAELRELVRRSITPNNSFRIVQQQQY